jgi:hypothetical protein
MHEAVYPTAPPFAGPPSYGPSAAAPASPPSATAAPAVLPARSAARRPWIAGMLLGAALVAGGGIAVHEVDTHTARPSTAATASARHHHRARAGSTANG